MFGSVESGGREAETVCWTPPHAGSTVYVAPALSDTLSARAAPEATAAPKLQQVAKDEPKTIERDWNAFFVSVENPCWRRRLLIFGCSRPGTLRKK
jgi:hypothetical protein